MKTDVDVQQEVRTKASTVVRLGIGIGVVAAFSIGAALSLGFLPAVSHQSAPDTIISEQPTCVDTDPGSYPDSYGRVGVRGAASGTSVNGTPYTYSDWCAGDGKQLMEYFCFANPDGNGKVAGQTGYNCKNGCVNGACVGTETRSCTDSDPGSFPNSYGRVAVRGFTTGIDSKGELYRQSDWCAGNGKQMMEYYCMSIPGSTDKASAQTGYNCQNSCVNGACTGTDTATCTDSQPVADIYVKGFVQGVTPTGEFYRAEDSCSGTGLQVNKTWCYANADGQVNGVQVMDCPSGRCANGACLR